MFKLKTGALALMGAASFCGGVRHKRYSGQQDKAPHSDYAQNDNFKKTQLHKNINN